MKKRTLLDDASYLSYLDWLANRIPPEHVDATCLSNVFLLTNQEARRLFKIWKRKEKHGL